jgi:hypothetical protein
MRTRPTKPNHSPLPKLKPDFKHRLSPVSDDATPCLLAEGVFTLANQAISTLEMVNLHFIEETDNRPSDDAIYWSIDAAMKLIMDMNALVEAYRKAVSPEQ